MQIRLERKSNELSAMQRDKADHDSDEMNKPCRSIQSCHFIKIQTDKHYLFFYRGCGREILTEHSYRKKSNMVTNALPALTYLFKCRVEERAANRGDNVL